MARQHLYAHVCTHTHAHTHMHTLTPPPLQGHHGFSSAEVGVGTAFPAAGLLLPRGEGGGSGAGGRRRVGRGWRGEVAGGCLFHGRMGFSLETLLPSTPSSSCLFLEQRLGVERSWSHLDRRCDSCQPALAQSSGPNPTGDLRPLTTTLPHRGKPRQMVRKPPSSKNLGPVNP